MTLETLRRGAHWLLLAGAGVVIFWPETRLTWFASVFTGLFLLLAVVNTYRAYKRGELTTPVRQLSKLPMDGEMLPACAMIVGCIGMALIRYSS